MLKTILATLALAGTLTGCSLSAQNKAIITANEIHSIAQSEGNIINSYCTPRYKAASSIQEIIEIDKVCLPAKDSYYVVKTAWNDLITVLQLAKNGNTIDKEIQDAALKLSNSLIDLHKIADKMQLTEVKQ